MEILTRPWADTQPRLPNNQLHIDPKAIAKFRDSYACLCFNMELTGHAINSELAGRDRPETVERLYKELNEWLNK